LRNDIKANNIEIFGDAEVNKPCEVYRKDAKDVNDEYSLNILFQEGNVEKMRQNVAENIEKKVVPSQVLKQDIIIDRAKAATMKVPLVIRELNTKTEGSNKELGGCRGWKTDVYHRHCRN
jgi:hypothetical protein